MSGDREGDTPTIDSGGAPVDFDRLSIIAERLATDNRFQRVAERPSFAPDRVVCVFDSRFYPASVSKAQLEIVWFENDEFSLHYHEDHPDGEFDHRWDRHPSNHNTDDHIHPGPDAPTPGVDTTHPSDWRDVLAAVLTEIEKRQRAFWSE